MSFCFFSNDYLMECFTLVDNLFINEYLPYVDEKHCKVYIYGLYLCNAPASRDNSIESMSKILDIPQDEILNIFQYWADNGLLVIETKNPLRIKYLSLKGTKQPPKKYKAGKYADFNKMVQQLFPTRQLVPNEYIAYYETMESMKIQPDAMLMIIQYCINYKGVSVRYPYITTVARNWSREGVHTVEDVEEKLNEYETLDSDLRAVMRALGRKGSSDIEEKQMYQKWTKNWGFNLPSILFAAKSCKRKGGFKKLDKVLDEFYRMNIYSDVEMKNYVKNIEHMRELSYKINTALGVFYETVENEIETYINPWLAQGFDDDALITIAKHCFVSNIKYLSGMDNMVQKFHKLGLLTTKSINEYIERQIQNDEMIKKILKATGTNRMVSNKDREFYRTWCLDWDFSDDIILYAAELSANSRFPIQFINKQLSKWKENNVKTLNDAKKDKISINNPKKPTKSASASNFTEREYTKEQLDAIFTSDDIEI